jgi:hypothetical protein
MYHSHSSSTRVYRPKLIGVNRSKLLPSTHILRHLRPSSLDPDPRSSHPNILVTMGKRTFVLKVLLSRIPLCFKVTSWIICVATMNLSARLHHKEYRISICTQEFTEKQEAIYCEMENHY